MNTTNIGQPEYVVYGYVNSFRKSKSEKPTWFAQVSLIVDKSKDKDKPFIFQYASLPCFGTAKQILQLHDHVEGAEGYYCKGNEGKPRLMRFTIKGYRAVTTDKNQAGFDIKGRIISIDEPYSADDFEWPEFPLGWSQN